ncbi:hypothetical protein LS684_06860 [Cytobacillus spongiae]|jgi:hypothetical protein|uniref:hypothetical protein n=1 Tax=Cytobacillus spongiae TaxID=2901381 RepID=UPI001F46C240|nr:hypothetical protein [Cytobacillus spongiae]UII57156.1 hypothetical protein LS684_06860 [Cytobacillus spongiae]
MDKKKERQKGDSSNVEFGIELGDMNAAKQYEIPFMNPKKKKNDEEDCDYPVQ